MVYVQDVAQLNLHVTPEFERALKRLMRLRGIESKSEAVRLAVEETAARAGHAHRKGSLAALRGAATKVAANPAPRFASEDDLWT